MHFDASFFVAVGFVLFVLLLGYLGVHTMLGKALNDRGAAVAKELDEARRLREEAEALLASFKEKAIAAEKEAAAIVATAREEAEAMAIEAARRSEEFVARRTKQAQDKIAMAEAQATSDVRAAATDAAVRAAESVLRSQVKGNTASDLVMKGIGELKSRLN